MKIFKSFLLAILFGIFAAAPLSAQVIAVIGNKDVVAEELSKDDLFKLLTQSKSYWTNDLDVKLIEYKFGGIKDAFYNKLGKDFGFFEKIWTENKFKGEGIPPDILASEAEVVKRVSETPGAIGYVSLASAMNNANVKILMQF